MRRTPPPPPERDPTAQAPETAPTVRPMVFKGRGAVQTPDGRFESMRREAFEDGWTPDDDEEPPPVTELFLDTAKSVITKNKSPDVSFELSINPYRGCEHGCTYCFARPSHSYLGLSPGLDFETKIGYKPDAVALLRKELAKPGYRCSPIALGINTDGWQPIERKLGLTRAILEVLAEHRHPVTIVTKGSAIERDVDLLAEMAKDGLVDVNFSITTLDRDLARAMEPRAASPEKRLSLVKQMSDAGIPTGVLFAPLIPALNDHEMEAVFEAARDAGAITAHFVLLRLSHELAELFPAWLEQYAPDRAGHVLSLIRQMRGGKLNDTEFGRRMRGQGLFAELYAKRARLATKRLGLNKAYPVLNTTLFSVPNGAPPNRTAGAPAEDVPGEQGPQQLSLW